MYFIGAVAAILVGVWLLSDYEESEGDATVLNELKDFFYVLSTSEESRLQQLEPTTQEKVRLLLQRLRDEDGIVCYVGQTLRSPAQEKANVDAGKTSAGLKYSWHELGRAVDMYPTVNGKPDYEATDLDQFRTMAEKAEEIGFRSLAFNPDGTKRLITNSKGKKIWDGGHIEWRAPYDTIAQAVAAEGATYGIA